MAGLIVQNRDRVPKSRTANRAKVRRRRRSPMFALWLALQRHGPMCARWQSFGTFYRDVHRSHRGGIC